MVEASTSTSRTDDRRRSRRDDHDPSRSSSRRRSLSPIHRRDDDQVGPQPANSVLTRFGATELTSSDYYARATEFKCWLAEYKRKYLDEISGQEARRYFEKFVRRWNEGRLNDGYYTGTVRTSNAPSAAQTRHRWAFTEKAGYTAQEEQQLALVRDSVDTLTNSSTRGAIEARNAERKRPSANDSRRDADETANVTGTNVGARDTGWSRPPSSSRVQTDASLHAAAQQDSRLRARQDERDQDEAWNGKATGRDRMLEKKRERNSANRDFAARRDADDGIEMDDRELFDDPPRSATPTTTSRHSNSKREQRAEQRKADMQEKVSVLKQKETDTMDMFKAMAQQRFGS